VHELIRRGDLDVEKYFYKARLGRWGWISRKQTKTRTSGSAGIWGREG
jgi:hypothetical protein